MLLLLALLSAAPLELQGRTVMVMPLSGKSGLKQDSADLITDILVTHLRDTGTFKRVISSREVVATLEMDKTRQLADCTQDSCLGEISAAFGADLLVTGSVGRLGDGLIFNLRLINTRSGVGVASVSRVVESAREEVLAQQTGAIANELLGLTPPAAPGSVSAGAVPSTQGPPRWRALRRAGAFICGGAVLAGGGLALGLGGALVSAGALALLGWQWDGAAAFYRPLRTTYTLSLVAAVAAAALLPVALLVAGGGAAVAGVSSVID